MENGGESWAMRVGSGSVVWDLPLENNGYHYLDYGGRVISSQESAPPVSLAHPPLPLTSAVIRPGCFADGVHQGYQLSGLYTESEPFVYLFLARQAVSIA
ncbi:capsule-associated protein Cap1 [Aspergillus luchuensis]|uniref:Capsule-associated protein Cap1 n=1 Tax=Aspergillus kawachii TaxID=1069201 RepID=A0A146FKZ7_ASPKA|nr:capsule-associated protein Cap1 [Aspergillus luchuensis]